MGRGRPGGRPANGGGDEARLETELGYGLPAFAGAGVTTPYAEFGLTQGGERDIRAGVRLGLGAGFDLALQARRDRTEWHRVVTFQDGLVDMLEKHARKGRLVYVAGKMQTRRWRKEGEDTASARPPRSTPISTMARCATPPRGWRPSSHAPWDTGPSRRHCRKKQTVPEMAWNPIG